MGIFNRNEPTQPNNPQVGDGNDPNQPNEPAKSQAELLAEGLSTALATLKETLTGISTRLEKVEGRVTPHQQPTEPNQPVQRTSVFDNEDLAIAERIAPVFQMQLETNARLVFNEVKQMYLDKGYAEVWNKYADKILTRVNAEPLLDGAGKPVRGNPERVIEIVNMVFGQAALESGVRFGGKDRGFFIESAGGGSESSSQQLDDGLSEDQRKFFIKNKIPLADGKAAVSKLKFWH